MKKIIKLSFLIIICFLLVGCFGGHIEDLNGEDNFALSTLNENSLIEGTSSSIMMGNITSEINNKFNQKVKKFSGVSELYELDENCTYEIEFNVLSGNGLVGIISDNKIIELVNPNNKITIKIPNNSDYIVKIVGESCQFEIIIVEK